MTCIVNLQTYIYRLKKMPCRILHVLGCHVAVSVFGSTALQLLPIVRDLILCTFVAAVFHFRPDCGELRFYLTSVDSPPLLALVLGLRHELVVIFILCVLLFELGFVNVRIC